jgi:hypothetical protein
MTMRVIAAQRRPRWRPSTPLGNHPEPPNNGVQEMKYLLATTALLAMIGTGSADATGTMGFQRFSGKAFRYTGEDTFTVATEYQNRTYHTKRGMKGISSQVIENMLTEFTFSWI